MTLKDARDAFYQLSGKLSDNVRQLSFAGIAVVWIFRSGMATAAVKLTLPPLLLSALLCFVGALCLDLLQYLYGAIAWGRYAHVQDKKGFKDTDTVSPPDEINWPTNAFFYLKTAAAVVGYAFVIWYLRGLLWE